MAFITETPRNDDLIERLLKSVARLLRQAAANHAQRRAYRDTLHALGGLTDRELDDLGLTRSNIRQVSWATSHGQPIR